jgi:nitrite reductase (NADH) small subunit
VEGGRTDSQGAQTVLSDDDAVAPQMSERDYVVGRVEDLPPGSVVIAPIGKVGVGVYNIDGDYYAIANYCPHQGAPLCLGRIQGTSGALDTGSGPTTYRLDGRVLRCPWHQWEFDVVAAGTITDPERRVRTYPVRVENGQVIVER